MLVLKSFCLLRDNPCIGPQECDEVVFKVCLKSVSVKSFCFEQVPTSIYLLEKRSFLLSFRLDRVILLLVSR